MEKTFFVVALSCFRSMRRVWSTAGIRSRKGPEDAYPSSSEEKGGSYPAPGRTNSAAKHTSILLQTFRNTLILRALNREH